jgi:hypothetical protein
MTPQNGQIPLLNESFKEMPSYTYRMDIKKERIAGNIDQAIAMEQAIYKVINTERYQYLIYSWQYGIELQDLIGHPVDYCVPEIERRITEALLCDTRIRGVSDFNFNISQKGSIGVEFSVQTIFGNITISKEVDV